MQGRRRCRGVLSAGDPTRPVHHPPGVPARTARPHCQRVDHLRAGGCNGVREPLSPSAGEIPDQPYGLANRFDRETFFWVASRAYLPEAWRWFSACVTYSSRVASDELLYTAQAVLQRVAKTFRHRDALLTAVNSYRTATAAEDAIDALETCLVFIVGAFDAAARVAHAVLGLSASTTHNAGWQKNAWLRQVRVESPDLADVCDSSTEGMNAFEVIRLLRNTVHGAGFRTTRIVGSTTSTRRTSIGLPTAQTSRLLHLVAQHGGTEQWGISPQSHTDAVTIEPDVALDRALIPAMDLLNRLLRATPVERLLTQWPEEILMSQPPGRDTPPDDDDIFAEHRTDSVRWQIGLNAVTTAP